MPGAWRHLDVRPIAGALGAEVHGVDLGRPLPDAAVAEIRQAWLEHLALFIRGHTLAPATQLAFARRPGEPVESPFVQGLPDHPTITPVVKLEHERVNFGGIWHTDTAYLERPRWAACSTRSSCRPAEATRSSPGSTWHGRRCRRGSGRRSRAWWP